MKSLLFMSAFLFWGAHSLASTTFNRVVPCTSFAMQSSISYGELNLDGPSVKELTKACSLREASLHGKRVCEEDSFAWLRPNYVTMKFEKSTIHKTTCKVSEGVYTCETPVTVVCGA